MQPSVGKIRITVKCYLLIKYEQLLAIFMLVILGSSRGPGVRALAE